MWQQNDQSEMCLNTFYSETSSKSLHCDPGDVSKYPPQNTFRVREDVGHLSSRPPAPRGHPGSDSCGTCLGSSGVSEIRESQGGTQRRAPGDPSPSNVKDLPSLPSPLPKNVTSSSPPWPATENRQLALPGPGSWLPTPLPERSATHPTFSLRTRQALLSCLLDCLLSLQGCLRNRPLRETDKNTHHVLMLYMSSEFPQHFPSFLKLTFRETSLVAGAVFPCFAF